MWIDRKRSDGLFVLVARPIVDRGLLFFFFILVVCQFTFSCGRPEVCLVIISVVVFWSVSQNW